MSVHESELNLLLSEARSCQHCPLLRLHAPRNAGVVIHVQVKASYWAALGIPPPSPPPPPPVPSMPSPFLAKLLAPSGSPPGDSHPTWQIAVPVTLSLVGLALLLLGAAVLVMRARKKSLFGGALVPGPAPDTTLVVRTAACIGRCSAPNAKMVVVRPALYPVLIFDCM